MTNLIIDLNNIWHRSVFATGGFGPNSFTFNTQAEIEKLMRKVSIDVTFLIRQINPNKVIFCVDSKSWRKDIPIEENEGYKGNREKAAHINWTNVYNSLNEFQDILKNKGFIVSNINRAEADDLICLWQNEFLYNKREHVIIASSDEDIRQLVKAYWKDDNKKVSFDVFSVVFNPIATGKNPTKKLYVPAHFHEWMNETEVADIFNLSAMDSAKSDFKQILNDSKVSCEIVDGDSVGVYKVLCGDDGDNVPAIYTWLKKDKEGNDVEKRITESVAKKIIEKLNLSDYLDVIEKADDVKKLIEEKSEKEINFDINKRIQRQVSLVVLNKHEFPEDIVNQFNEELEKQLNISRTLNNSLSMQMLLEGTRFISENYKEASIFKEIDRITTKLF